jgi:hypothetical protein
MDKAIRFEIGQEEWNALPEKKRARLMELMNEYFEVDVQEMIDGLSELEDDDSDLWNDYDDDCYPCGCCMCCGCSCDEDDEEDEDE